MDTWVCQGGMGLLGVGLTGVSKVSVIIPVRKGDSAARTVDALKRQTFGGTIEILTSSTGENSAVERNLAAANATGDILLFTDADCIPEQDWVENIVSAYKKGVAAVCGSFPYSEKSYVGKCLDRANAFKFQPDRPSCFVDYGPTANFSVRREVFERLGGFNESFVHGHDMEFCMRIKASGRQLFFLPEAKVYHKHGRSGLWDLIKHNFSYGVWAYRVHSFHGMPLEESRFYLRPAPLFLLLSPLLYLGMWFYYAKNLVKKPGDVAFLPGILFGRLFWLAGAVWGAFTPLQENTQQNTVK